MDVGSVDGRFADPALAFQTRQKNFPDEMDFFAPGLKRYTTTELVQSHPRAWLPVSLTGSGCALACDHCKMQVLRPMISAPNAGGLYELCRDLAQDGTRGVLISGGSDRNGEVPLLAHMDQIARVKQVLGLRVVVHTGLATPETARALRTVGVDGAMIDLIGSDETVHEVYHLPHRTAADFEASLAALKGAGLRVIPHIVLGLHYGEFRGEFEALRMVTRQQVETLVLVVLTPLVGTPMETARVPDLEEIRGFFAHARLALPEARLLLGCARPMGPVKTEIDRAAVDAGLNGIAYPADGIVRYARSRGLRPRLFEFCCSLTWETD
jgi:lipoyl synthase